MKRKITITTILLIVALGNYFRIVSDGNARTVEFLSILTVGILLGILLTQLTEKIQKRSG